MFGDQPDRRNVELNTIGAKVQDGRRLTPIRHGQHVELGRSQKDCRVEVLTGADTGVSPVEDSWTCADVADELGHRADRNTWMNDQPRRRPCACRDRTTATVASAT